MTYALWILQALLALTFVFAGSMKLAMPIELLTAQVPLPGLFIRIVGAAELLGGLGLILPGLLRIRPSLTWLAATELAHVMLAATILTLATGGDPLLALIPLFIAGLLAFVAYGRWRLASQASQRGGSRRRVSLQAA